MYCSVSLMKIERSQVRPVPFEQSLERTGPQQAFVNSTKENGPPPGGTCGGAREVDTNVLFGDTPKNCQPAQPFLSGSRFKEHFSCDQCSRLLKIALLRHPILVSDPGIGTRNTWRALCSMPDDKPTDKTGNEPAPLLLVAVAIVPLLAVAGWFVFG